MLIDVLEFFRNLPKKSCKECGFTINEQSECYTTVCESCLRAEYEKSTVKETK